MATLIHGCENKRKRTMSFARISVKTYQKGTQNKISLANK